MSVQVLLAQHSRPTSVDGPAQGHTSRDASADHNRSSRASSAQLARLQRSSSEATAALSVTNRGSDEQQPLQYSHLPGGSPLCEGHHWEEHGGHALGDIPELAPSNFSADRCAARQHCCTFHVLCMLFRPPPRMCICSAYNPQITCPFYCTCNRCSSERTIPPPCPSSCMWSSLTGNSK